MVDILVIGATGFCGRHAARYVLEHPERSKYTVGLAARSRSKLTSIDLPIDNSVQIFELDIQDEQALEDAVKKSKVVLNCIGPFWHYGTPVVQACARNGIHYVRLSGIKTHAIIVPSCGVDSIPADASVYLASKALGHVPLGTSTTSAGLYGGAPGGTLASFVAILEDVPTNHLSLSARDWALSPVPGAPSPRPRLVYSLGSMRGGLAVFGPINRAFVQRTAGLLELARRRGVNSGPVYGPAFTYTEFTPTSNVFSAFFYSLALATVFAGLTFIAPVQSNFIISAQFRWLFKRLVTQPGSGPADHTLENGRLEYVNVTMSDEPVPRYAKTIIKGSGDPGTLLTAEFVGESALALLLDELPPLAKEGGVLTPITAFGDNIIRRLEKSGRFEITTRIVDGPGGGIEESRKAR
ncbi:hypothetical protein B0F90DRAFT_1809886 [Multifurca ochricompacta]|uniref:Saccharopine dehydrogenase NADP binding domain-containing protein n=1 Tax=Multifurca ochricompacta TaxID=376703 RepID=A0AAD4M5X7_9AGAM|nr:hypothetical protein B0F90DRAFT_1809886 [Multifurca ochricompacta]